MVSLNLNRENGICSDGGTAIPGDSDQQPQPPNTPGDAYKRLDEDEKLKVRTIVYIMDRFSISLQGYHELTQVDKSLPRTHLLETCTKLMDSQWDIKRTPGTSQGAELPLKLLLEKEIRQHLKNSKGADEPIKVKISGDGARMSHTSNLFVCSFSLLDDGQTCLSSSGNHTIAVVKGKEEHETLKSSLSNVIKDVNSLIDDGYMIIDGRKVSLEFYLGGDYKFLLIAMGMKGATSNNSCIYCKIYKNERCDMSKNCCHFSSPPLARSVCDDWHKQPGCHSQPFFKLPLENIVVDELHLMLRVTDRLEEGIIKDILKWDEDDNINKPPRERTDSHLQEFLLTVHSLGVSFSIYHTADKWEWTSLLGGEKRLLLRKLPEQFNKFLPEHKVEATKSLWINFRELLDCLNSELTDDGITEFETKALNWGKQMVDMSGSGPGYKHTIIITPYMHILIYHVPLMLQRHGSLRIFSGQGVEKKNDDFRRYFHRKINRWDAAKNLLLVEKRQERLRDCERGKRLYMKRKTSFWLEGGKQEAAKKVVRISTSTPQEQEYVQPATVFVEHELKKKKVAELLTLLFQTTGRRLGQKSRKQDVINALLQSSSTRSE
ncbi:hypothetical protein OS493_028083 [Desmophyllum pertusum]|uniref:Uncharacterized protein n=1 Tax=Desmophyllum pertusum TaxID=174260 RepID=A0A9W9ZKK9_9CNID|nr:hypothetical protein OS493_028083 [Desmophyllum pertusum]